jgi:hypothetical protein
VGIPSIAKTWPHIPRPISLNAWGVGLFAAAPCFRAGVEVGDIGEEMLNV